MLHAEAGLLHVPGVPHRDLVVVAAAHYQVWLLGTQTPSPEMEDIYFYTEAVARGSLPDIVCVIRNAGHGCF